MPYTFTSWTAYTDPNSVARTLSWDSSAMAGTFPGIYLEALRQACELRRPMQDHAGLSLYNWTTAMSIDYAFQRLNVLLPVIDAIVWETQLAAPWSLGGWVIPSEFADFSGADAVPVFSSDADLLTAIGDSARVPVPTTLLGRFSGAWLRQCQKVLAQKVILWSGNMSLNILSSATRQGTAYTAAGAISAYGAASWVSGSVGGDCYRTLTYNPGPGTFTTKRRAVVAYWDSPGDRPCTQADTYCVALSPAVANWTWEEDDYALSTWGARLRLQAAVDMTDQVTQELGRIDAWTGTAEPAGDVLEYAGWEMYRLGAVFDWRDDWGLAAT